MKLRILFTLIAFVAAPILHAQRQELRSGERVVAHGLSFNPSVITDDMPESLRELLRIYKTQPPHSNRMKGESVAPLLNSAYSQSEPYNRLCPYYKDDAGKISENRCVVGCVATSLAHVLRYYAYPEALLDTLHGWSTDNYTIQDVLPGTRIDWEHILPTYDGNYSDTEANAVAELMLYCGMAVQMNYGIQSSGANLYKAEDVLKKSFGYKTVVPLERSFYSNESWNRILRSELSAGRPICYTGHNLAMSGHAFNIDGVDEEGYYHLNWSYGGRWDGYFDLDYLNPFESSTDTTELGLHEGLFNNQTALLIHPGEVEMNYADSLTLSAYTTAVQIEDISFRRQPDLQFYTIADVKISNLTDHDIYYTFQALSAEPSDEEFSKPEAIAITSVKIPARQQITWPLYCRFKTAGQRIMGLTCDGDTIIYKTPVNVVSGTTPKLQFGSVTHKMELFGDNLSAIFYIDISNNATQGYSGNLVTFCLFPADEEVDLRHWHMLNLAGGETERVNVRFQHLEDGGEYKLLIRCPWEVQQEYSFTARKSDATGIISLEKNEVGEKKGTQAHTSAASYDLSGKKFSPRVKSSARRIIIKNGRKILWTQNN